MKISARFRQGIDGRLIAGIQSGISKCDAQRRRLQRYAGHHLLRIGNAIQCGNKTRKPFMAVGSSTNSPKIGTTLNDNRL